MGYKTSFAFRALIWIIAFGLCVWGMLLFGAKLGYFRDLFFKLGNWEAAIAITILGFAIGGVLRYLVILMWNLETGRLSKPKSIQRHRRR